MKPASTNYKHEPRRHSYGGRNPPQSLFRILRLLREMPLQPRVEPPVTLVGLSVRAHGDRAGFHPIEWPEPRPTCLIDRRKLAGADCRKHRGPIRRAPDGAIVTTGIPNTSASIWRHTALRAPPPTATTSSASTFKRRISSSESRSAKATPSNTARTRCPLSCPACIPANTPRAFESACGVRSPVRYGKNVSPSAPGGMRAASAISSSYDGGTPPGPNIARRNHASAAPADRTTPIWYHVLSTAWLNRCNRIPGSTRGRSIGASIVPDVPMEACIAPCSTTPEPTAAAALSAPPPTTGMPCLRPNASAASAVSAPVTPAEPRTGGSILPIKSQCSNHLFRPAATPHVEQQRACRIRRLRCLLARQRKPHEVLWQQERARLVEQARLLVAHPQQLGRRKALESGVANHPPKTRLANLVDYGLALHRGANVVPQNRWPQHSVCLIQQHRAVHLAGQPNRLDLPHTCLSASGPDRLTVPSHQSCGSCSAQPGPGTDTSRGDSASPTTAPASSTTRAFTAVVPTSIPR